MTGKEITERVDKIITQSGDPEMAHSQEDDLMSELVKEYAPSHIADKIDLNKIRGQWSETVREGYASGGDDTVESIRLVAEKVNEIISILEKYDTR